MSENAFPFGAGGKGKAATHYSIDTVNAAIEAGYKIPMPPKTISSKSQRDWRKNQKTAFEKFARSHGVKLQKLNGSYKGAYKAHSGVQQSSTIINPMALTSTSTATSPYVRSTNDVSTSITPMMV